MLKGAMEGTLRVEIMRFNEDTQDSAVPVPIVKLHCRGASGSWEQDYIISKEQIDRVAYH